MRVRSTSGILGITCEGSNKNHLLLEELQESSMYETVHTGIRL